MRVDTRTFIVDVAERAGKAAVFAAASLAATLGVSDGALSLADYQHLGSVALGAAVLSVLFNLAAGLRTGTASLSRAVASQAVSQAPGAHTAPASGAARALDPATGLYVAADPIPMEGI